METSVNKYLSDTRCGPTNGIRRIPARAHVVHNNAPRTDKSGARGYGVDTHTVTIRSINHVSASNGQRPVHARKRQHSRRNLLTTSTMRDIADLLNTGNRGWQKVRAICHNMGIKVTRKRKRTNRAVAIENSREKRAYWKTEELFGEYHNPIGPLPKGYNSAYMETTVYSFKRIPSFLTIRP